MAVQDGPGRLDCAPDCPACQGAGWVSRAVSIDHPDFGQAYPCPRRELTDEGARRRYRYAQLPQGLRCASFDDFDPRPGTQAALQAAREFAAGRTPYHGLTLAGTPGNGKTTLLAALGHAYLAQGRTVKYAFVPDLMDRFRASFRDNAEVSYEELLLMYQAADLLLLDDVGDERVTEFAVNALYRLIDGRYRQGRPYAVATNITEPRMEELWGYRITDRVFDSGTGAVRVVFNTAPSYRTGR